MHSLHFMRPVLNSSDINYAGKLFFKIYLVFLKNQPALAVCAQCPCSHGMLVEIPTCGNPGWTLFFHAGGAAPCRKHRAVLTDPAVVAAIYFVVCVCLRSCSRERPPISMMYIILIVRSRCADRARLI